MLLFDNLFMSTRRSTTTNPPVNLVVPNIVESKMEAIVNLSRAVAALSEALSSTHVYATISNNTIVGAKGSAIKISNV